MGGGGVQGGGQQCHSDVGAEVREEEGSTDEQERHAMKISGPGGAQQGNGSSLGIAQNVQSCIIRLLLAKRADQLLEDVRVQGTMVRGKHALVRYTRAQGKRVMAWVACQGTTPNRAMALDRYREILVRGLASHDEDRCFGGRCQACGSGRSSVNHSLACSRRVTQTHKHIVLPSICFVMRPARLHLMHERDRQRSGSCKA